MHMINIPAAQASKLLSHAQVLSVSLAALRPIDTDQPELALGIDQALDETMAERDIHLQAIEAFMDEREDLKAEVEDMAAGALEAASIAGEAIAKAVQAEAEVAQLLQENAAIDAACMKAARFVHSLRVQLRAIGIEFHVTQDSEAAITIDLPVLTNSVEAIVERSAG